MALTDILDKLGGQQGQEGGVAAISRLFGGNGLEGIMSTMHSNGMGQHVQSWVGTGQNMSVSGSDVKSMVNPQLLTQLAGQRGMSPEQICEHVAQALPGLVDHATPNGQVPRQGSSVESLMGAFRK